MLSPESGAEPRHFSAVSLMLRILLAAVITVLAVVAGLCLPVRVRTWAGNAESPRPRWQYLLAAACALAVAGCSALLSPHAAAGLAMRVSAAAATWSGLYALALIGRATAWGRVRALLWWHLWCPAPAQNDTAAGGVAPTAVADG